MNHIQTILFSLLLALPKAVQAQPDFGVFDLNSGLPETRIRALCQMPDGRMAIATAGTVTIYDGTHFTVYDLRPQDNFPLPDYHGLRHLTCDSTGLVWLRNDGSLHVVDTRQRQVVSNVDSLLDARRLTTRQVSAWPVSEAWRHSKDYQNMSPLVDDEISALVRDCYGGLWVGLKEGGMLYSNPVRKRQFHTTSNDFAHECQHPFCSPRASQLSARYAPSATNCSLDGRTMSYTFLGTRHGIMIIDRKDQHVTTLDEHDGLSTNNVVALLGDRHGDVWAATANGLTRIHQVKRDSFDIVNYGLLDGIDTGGREFRTCQIHCDAEGWFTVGFAGGTITFHPDSVNAPRYTFHYPRNDKAANNPPRSKSHWMWWTVPLLACWCFLALAIVRKRRKGTETVTPPQAPSQASSQPSPGDKGCHSDGSPPFEGRLGGGLGDAMAQDIARRTAEKHLTSSELAFLDRLKVVIEAHLSDEDFSVQSLSEAMAMDRTVLYRRMQTLTGVSPSVYVRNIRMDAARRLLRDTDLSVGEIASKTGFATAKYFSSAFKDSFGMTPNEYRKSLPS